MSTEPRASVSPPDLARLVRVLREAYDLAVTALTPVPGGADTRARTLRATAAGGTTYAVRVSSEPTAAPAVLDLLTRNGIVAVPAPRRTGAGQLSVPVPGGHLTVLEWVEGTADHRAGLTADQWIAFGRLLRRVHDTDPHPGTDAHRSLPIGTDDLGWYDQTLEAVRSELAGHQQPDDPQIVALRSLWTTAADRIEAMRTRLHELAGELRLTTTRRVVCHTDPHLGNVVLDPRGGVHLIDWDDAAYDPVERDLMFVLGGVIADRPVRAAEQRWFFTGYGPVALDPALVTWFRGRRAIEDAALPALEILRSGRTRIEVAGELAVIRGVLSPTGLIDQTLSG